MYGMPENIKEQYCKGDYRWCGRYMTFKARERLSPLKGVRETRVT